MKIMVTIPIYDVVSPSYGLPVVSGPHGGAAKRRVEGIFLRGGRWKKIIQHT